MCERCLELEERVHQLQELLTPVGHFPSTWLLTKKEAQVLSLFMTRPMVTRDSAMTALYGGMDEPHAKIIDVFVFRVRQKVPYRVITQHRVGWFMPPEDREALRNVFRSAA